MISFSPYSILDGKCTGDPSFLTMGKDSLEPIRSVGSRIPYGAMEKMNFYYFESIVNH